MERERMLAVGSCTHVKIKPGIDVKSKKGFCIFFWNKREVGRTAGRELDFLLVNRNTQSDSSEQAKGLSAASDIKPHGERAPDKSVSLPSVPAGRSRGGAILLQRSVNVFWGSDELESIVCFTGLPPEEPSKEGNLLEIELVVEMPTKPGSGMRGGRMSMVNRMSLIASSVLGDEKALAASDGPMLVSLGCASLVGNALDQWVNSRTPQVKVLEMMPSNRFPQGMDGAITKKISALSMMSQGVGFAPPQPCGTMNLTSLGTDCMSPHQVPYPAEP